MVVVVRSLVENLGYKSSRLVSSAVPISQPANPPTRSNAHCIAAYFGSKTRFFGARGGVEHHPRGLVATRALAETCWHATKRAF